MSEKENKTVDDTVSSKGPSLKTSVRDPLGSTIELISKAVPPGVDRRSFLIRSAVGGAAAVMTGSIVSAHERIEKAVATLPVLPQQSPAPPLDPKLNVVQKGKGPVLTTVDEFYKVGGPCSACLCAREVSSHEHETSGRLFAVVVQWLREHAVSAETHDAARLANREDKQLTIDTHHHILPDFFWRETNDSHAPVGGLSPLQWSKDAMISFMDDAGIDVAVMSVSTPGVLPWR